MASDAQGQRENADAICPNVFNRGGSGLDSAVAGGQEPFEGVERLLKVNPYVSLAKKGDDWGQQKFKFCGRPSAAQPDYAQVLRAFRGFIEPFRQILNPLLVNLVGKRKDEACAYSSLTLYWTVILGFFQHLRSRNQMDMLRNTRAYSQTVLELSGQPYDTDDTELHTACSQTCRNFLAQVDATALELVLVQLVRYLIRSKWFRDAMLYGCICVAVDGTLCERKRGSHLSSKEKRRYVLEARIVTPWGWNIPLLSEAVEAYDGDKEKQDCEYKAFVRLAKRLKQLFPKQAFCIIGDALYCCRPIMDICRKNNWDFILTFKEGTMPKVYRAVQLAKQRTRSFSWMTAKNASGGEKTVGVVSWVNAMECAYELGDGEDFRVVTYFSWDATEDGGAYSGCFATSFEVTEETRALNIAAWGRRRWNIETGFLVEKHGGFGLEHTFCNDDTAGRNYHLLMQIAYTLWQVFDTGVLSRLSDRCRKASQEMWAKLLFIAVLVLGLTSVPHVTAGAMRMRRYHLVA